MKKLLLGSTRLFRNYGRDTEGATAITFGLGLTAMLLAMGAGIDFAMAAKKQASAQDLADQVGLAAAVYIKNSRAGVAPQSDKDGLRDGVAYKAKDLGKSGFALGDTDAEVVVDYGIEDATVTVRGTIPTTFMALAGIEETAFSAKSVIKYEKIGIRASSVMLVLDNSGSMAWNDLSDFKTDSGEWETPTEAQSRIDGLKAATQTLLDEISTLEELVDLSSVVRTGMIPFSGTILDNNRVWMDWGLVTDVDVDAMQPDGLTNSAPPMQAALAELQGEEAAHALKENADPLKFAIFMTDGVNTVSQETKWTRKSGTELYKTNACFNYFGCFDFYDTTADFQNDPPRHGYENHWAFKNQTAWEEGTLRNEDDIGTLKDCETLKNEGVYVYAIGFAVNPGRYGGTGGNPQTIDDVFSNRIYSFLEECSSGPGFYKVANTSASLDDVFKKIGQTIHKRSIYVAR